MRRPRPDDLLRVGLDGHDGQDGEGADLALARRAAREAARDGSLAVARVEERERTRFQLDSRHEAAQGSSVVERTLVVRVVTSEGASSSEGARTSEVVRSKEVVLGGPFHSGPALDPHGVWRAVVAGLEEAARGKPIELELSLSVTFERSRLALARATGDEGEDVLERASLEVAIEGDLRVLAPREVAGSFRTGGRLGPGEDLTRLLAATREASRRALQRATARTRRPVALPRRARLALLSPDVLTWVLHAPIVEGLRAARAGARAELPRWLEIDDGGALEGGDAWPDETGLTAGPVPLVAAGRWSRGPFRPFDGSGRTRRDRLGELTAELASIVARVVPPRTGFVAPRRALEARADLALTEVASADPLPGGGVAIVAHALVRAGRRWAPAGLASVRLRGRGLWPRCVGASAEIEAAWAQRLPLELPWLLVEGLALRPAL